MPRVTFFGIQADDTGRAISFYSEVFGWKFKELEGFLEYWDIATGEEDEPGIDGGLTPRLKMIQANTFFSVVEVPDVDEYVARIKIASGKMLSPKFSIPGVGYLVP